MRLLRLIAATALAAAALVGLFIAFCVLPKVEQAEADWHTTMPGWVSGGAALTGYWMLDVIYLLAALLVLAFVIALLPFVGQRIRSIALSTIYLQTWATAAAAIYLLIVGIAGMIYVNEDLWSKNLIYAGVLDKFMLLESANNQFDQVQAYMAHMSSAQLVEVKDVSTLTQGQRTEQIHGLVSALKSTDDVALLKQVLAYSDWFRKDIVVNTNDAKAILDAAAKCGAPSTDVIAFYDWLEPKIGTDGWNKLPLHVLEFSR